MAPKTPDTITRTSLGDFKLIIAAFSSTDIDDNDTWDTGMKSIVAHWTEQTVDGPNDLTIDAVSNGTVTFGSGANLTGYVFLIGRDY